MAGIGKTGSIAKYVSATNENFQGKRVFYLPSSNQLYMLPSQFTQALVLAGTVQGATQENLKNSILYSLKECIAQEMEETHTKHCLIDTSPFFSGATHLTWHASDALIVPVCTDQQSINSLQLLIKTLSDGASEFGRIQTIPPHRPKIQMIVLTHCGWSTVSGSRNKPNQQTKVYVEKVYDIIRQNIVHFTTNNPDNHILLLDDFLGTGRISSAKSKPIALLTVGESMTISRVRTEVNASVTKVLNQLKYISDSIW